MVRIKNYLHAAIQNCEMHIQITRGEIKEKEDSITFWRKKIHEYRAMLIEVGGTVEK